ncbi:peptidoglycan editing factor PgeF [Colwellia sp. RE-S-Sl-9]
MNRTNSFFNHVIWPVQNVVAFTTTIHHPNQLEYLSAYGNFNLGLHVGDEENIVLSHRRLLLDYLPANTSIQWLDQVHGNNVEVIKQESEPHIADASTTQQRHIALAIMTADCLPIIISSLDGSDIAAIHGGWKPLSKNIIQHTIQKMKTPANELYVWLGPCIGPEKFEVGEDVYGIFMDQHNEFSRAFTSVDPQEHKNKYLANLQLIAEIQLKHLGVNHIYSLPHCTFSMKDNYYSYRRDNKTGRMATIICRA